MRRPFRSDRIDLDYRSVFDDVRSYEKIKEARNEVQLVSRVPPGSSVSWLGHVDRSFVVT